MHSEHATQPAATSRTSRKGLKSIAAIAAVIIVFLLGLNIGNGTIAVTSGANTTNKSAPEDLDYASVEQVYDLLRRNYDGKLDDKKLLEGMKAGLTKAAGDTYTQYFSPEEAAAFDQELSGTFTGIGAELGEDNDGNLIVVAPMEGFPASKAGVRSKDMIVAIDGKSTSDMTIAEAVKLIRGERNTKVTLRILRNKQEDVSITITRADIKVPSVKSELLDGNVGYIKLVQFSEDTASLTQQAAKDLLAKGATSVVLDMRDNPGGLLNAAIDIADLWLPAGKIILSQKQGGVTTETYVAKGSNDLLADVPTAVLINAGSASASEIVAGALRDNKAATLFGEKSFGKGSVQEINPLANGGEVKITIARWYRPNGQNIDQKGIRADKEVKMTEDDYKNDRDPQKDAALQFVRSQKSQ